MISRCNLIILSFLFLTTSLSPVYGETPEELVRMGVDYYTGRGVPVDKVKAVECWKQAAEQGNAKAQFALANCYQKGEGVEKDDEEAAKWFQKAAEQGYAGAQNKLGICYYNGIGVLEDKTEAVKWYRKAADQGLVSAQIALALCCEFGNGTSQDLTEAAKWYRKAAEQGDVEAQCALALFYEYGKGVDKNWSEALQWYRKAAEQGYAPAQYVLGKSFASGNGVTKNMNEALTWLNRSANQGNADAQFLLSIIYATGRDVTLNVRLAMEWLKLAAKQGHPQALNVLREIAKEGHVEARKFLEDLENESSGTKTITQVAPATNEVSNKEYKAGNRKVVIINGVEFAFRWCPAGTFMMGMSAEEEALNLLIIEKNKIRQHQVTLTKGFWMMETEVTQKQWKAVMGNNPSNFKGDDLPVENVSWNDCQTFCRKTNLKLPTEAQWEYACRAGTTGAYAGYFNVMAWYYSNSGKQTSPVGTKHPNAWGLYDMHGNVWEWCQDWYGDYPNGSETDPIGASSGPGRVLRGGGWDNFAEDCRSAFRSYCEPNNRSNYFGFRCVIVP